MPRTDLRELRPFFDGNGQLLQADFPLTVIQVEERARYLGALDQGLGSTSPVE